MGFPAAEAARSRVEGWKALASFRKKSDQRLYGFPHLPFQTAVVKDVNDYAASVRGSYVTAA